MFGRYGHNQMHMIHIKANRLYRNAGHSSKQLRQELTHIAGHARLQDPTAVFAYPNHVVPKIVNTVSCLYVFHAGIIPPPGSFIHG